jgi:hypothetical protein
MLRSEIVMVLLGVSGATLLTLGGLVVHAWYHVGRLKKLANERTPVSNRPVTESWLSLTGATGERIRKRA